MSLQSSYGYSGRKFSVVNDDCICFISANAVCVWNITIGKKDFLWSKKNGYTACTANYMKGYIAAAEYGLDPDIHIYKYPGSQMVAKIKAETKIKCTDLTFSRDCTRLLMIGDKPDYKISIYDLEERKMLTINETLKDKQYLKAEFNPADSDQFYVASPNVLTFYSIIRNSYTITKDENGEGTINK